MKRSTSLLPVFLVLLATFGFFHDRFFEDKDLESPVKDSGVSKINTSFDHQDSRSSIQLVLEKNQFLDDGNGLNSRLNSIFQAEMLAMNSLDENPDETENRLVAIAKNLTAEDIKELSSMAINSEIGTNEKVLSTYILSLVGPRAQNGLIRIFSAHSEILNKHIPAHSIQESIQQSEISVRLMALKGIEANLHSARLHLPREVHSENSYLNNMAKLVRLGEATGRPLLQETLAENIKHFGEL